MCFLYSFAYLFSLHRLVLILNLCLYPRSQIEESTLEWLAEMSDGDARIALNSLQIVHQSKPASFLSLEDVKNGVKVTILFFLIYLYLLINVSKASIECDTKSSDNYSEPHKNGTTKNTSKYLVKLIIVKWKRKW